MQDVNAKGAASVFAANIARNAFPGTAGAVSFANPGDLLTYIKADGTTAGQTAAANNLFVIDRFTNLGGVRERSLAVNVDYQPRRRARTIAGRQRRLCSRHRQIRNLHHRYDRRDFPVLQVPGAAHPALL
jgi:hypothetical protein